MPIRLQHHATCLAETLSLWPILFPKRNIPSDCPENVSKSLPKLKLYDRKLEENKEQMKTIDMIVSGCSRPFPYIVFGPPGTGKTVTIVEAIKQIVKLRPNCHILACASSNTAADLLTERLMEHIQLKDIFRMHAESRLWNTVPEKVKAVSNYDKTERHFYYPSKTTLMNYKIIVATLITAGRLAGAAFPKNHITHVFMDEIGQAVEPEALIAITSVITDVPDQNGCHIILAGDPKQLGPVLRSFYSQKYGLGQSLLKRLMDTSDVYQRLDDGNYDNRFITKLLRNYRSHPDILKVPNELFYMNELQSYADPVFSTSLCHWECLPKKGFPILFHGIIGKDEREASNPSYFNTAEVSVVTEYVKKLLSTRGKINVKPESIGIISPYSQQVRKIRQALMSVGRKTPKEIQNKDINKITIGSVEQFQGQERLIIIISTVRSHTDLLKVDYEYNLGFIRNQKRFNVALTRAKALLIVVGNPHILRFDRCWMTFLKFCMEKGGMAGCKFHLDKDATMAAQIDNYLSTGRSLSEAVNRNPEDPSWRNEP